MKPVRGPQTEFFSNHCSGIPGLANYEMPNEVCEGNFWERFLGTVTAVRHGLAVTALAQAPDDQQSWNTGYWQLGLGTLA